MARFLRNELLIFDNRVEAAVHMRPWWKAF